jgi:phage gpG-like protein
VYELHGFERLQAALKGLALAVGDSGMRPVLEDIGIVAEAAISRAFSRETAPEIVAGSGKAESAAGQPWAELSDSTKRGRRGDGDAAIILRDTGRLSQSIGQSVDRLEVTVGSGVRYGAPHQTGTLTTDKLPARPFIGVDYADVDRMTDLVVRHLEAALG